MVPFPKHLGLQKHLFRYSLKMPACMIIFKILFSQKHCTLYLYSNGHIWIPIYEFEICVSVKKHANRIPTFGNGFGIQKRLQKAVQFMNLKFVYLSKNMPTEYQHLVMVLAYRKDCRRQFKYQVSCPGLAMERISVLWNFL